MAKFFKIPFAATGDVLPVPDATQADGSVSYSQGFGPDYQRKTDGTDPLAKTVPRDSTNALFNDITGAVGEIQLNGVSVWQSVGAPYPINAIVRHNNKNWISQIANNNDTPAEGASWSELPSNSYTKAQVDTKLALKANAATTLSGYGITDAYTKSQVDTKLALKANAATTLSGYGITDAYTKSQVDTKLALKANAATTLSGYGITDAYTKTESDGKFVGKDSQTGAAILPSGTTAQRPLSPLAGMLRYNSTLSQSERYSSSKWLAHGDMDGALNEAPIVTIASAATVNIGAAAANTINISGTSTISSLGTADSGITRRLVFQAALTLVHNSSSLIIPGGSSITTSAGDVAEVVSLGDGNWRCTDYVRASGAPVSIPCTYTAELELTAGAIYPITHPHGIDASVEFVYVCKAANIGYSVGDELELKDFRSNPDTGARTMGAFITSKTSSGFNIGLGNGAAWTFPAKATGAATTITLASWRVKARIKP